MKYQHWLIPFYQCVIVVLLAVIGLQHTILLHFPNSKTSDQYCECSSEVTRSRSSSATPAQFHINMPVHDISFNPNPIGVTNVSHVSLGQPSMPGAAVTAIVRSIAPLSGTSRHDSHSRRDENNTQFAFAAAPSSEGGTRSLISSRALEGVAVTVFQGSPKWYQNRYTLMVNQVLSVLPTTWAVQVIFNPANKMAVEGTKYPGIQRQIRRNRVFLTEIPVELRKHKKNNLLLTSWFWAQLMAENVLMFGGNSVLCANSPLELSDFIGKYTYIGAPWKTHQGMGGSSGLSLRNRTAILNIVQKLEREGKLPGAKGGPKEDFLLVQELLLQQKQQQHHSKMKTNIHIGLNDSISLPGPEDTKKFAMAELNVEGAPLGSVGTLGALHDKQRQQYIDYCPEMKMMFPSLHSPHCFGAEPNPIECFRYLCVSGGLKCGRKEFDPVHFKEKNGRTVTISIVRS